MRRELKTENVLVQRVVVGATHAPRCATCWNRDGVVTPHPKAYKPPVLTGRCPVCNTKAPRPTTIYGPAWITGWHPLAILSNLMSWVGLALFKLAKRFSE